ncbi:MAG: hypothetical protein OXB98_15380 [Bryobacterales bacterium]|nr:hypothetical protein [Bryobacterales bacterium]
MPKKLARAITHTATPHGFRSSFWDPAAAKTDHSPEVIEDSDGGRASADI